MSIALQLGLAIGSIAILLGLMWIVRGQARRYDLSAEVQRKLVHIGTGLYALTLPWLFPERWPVYVLVGLTLIVMIVLRLPKMATGGIGETLHSVDRTSYGDILLALAVGTVFLLADGRVILYVLPIAVLTLADAAAALTGSRYGRRFFQIEDGQKSIEGSAAFFMITLILAMIALLLLSEVERGTVVLLAIMVAAFGTLVEADSWRGFDNFFLPAGLMIFLESNLETPAINLFGLTLVFAVSLILFLGAAPRLGLNAHAARVYAISAFLLLSVTALHNTVLPLLVFVFHAFGRHLSPSASDHPELDIVASLALASFAWLSIGLATDLNALRFYNLHALGLGLSLITIAFVAKGRSIGLLAGAGGAIALAPLYFWIVPLNAAAVAWTGSLPVWVGLTITAAVVVPALRPLLFQDRRAAKLTLLTGTVPALAYLWNGAFNKGLL